MAVDIMLKSGAWYSVDAFVDEVRRQWAVALSGTGVLQEYTRLDGGIPRPKIVIDMREIEHLREARR
jgi:hypothetical protein